MHWKIVTPFTHSYEVGWIPNYIESADQTFEAIPARYAHDRSRRRSGRKDWSDYLTHAITAWFSPRKNLPRDVGYITCFPQLALGVSLLKKLSFSKAPLIAWTFNMGQTYGGLRGSIARFALSSVDLFVVHTTAEIEAYSSWLRLPKSRFVFVPLGISVPTGEVDSLETQEPFVLSMGSANRDYDCLFRAVGELGYRTIVVAGEHSTEGLDIPKNVDLRSGLSLNQCHALSRAARVNVVPIKDEDSPSGQVTFLETMIFGKAMVLTECAGTRDYVTSGENGVLVAPNTTSEMRDAIFMLWNDRELRNRIGDAAKRRVLDQSTLEGIAPTMLRLLQRF